MGASNLISSKQTLSKLNTMSNLQVISIVSLLLLALAKVSIDVQTVKAQAIKGAMTAEVCEYEKVGENCKPCCEKLTLFK